MKPTIFLIAMATVAFGETYTLSTFAGVWLPENLPGSSISLNQVGGVAVDAGGNVFLSLPRYAAVMRLDAKTGILTRVPEMQPTDSAATAALPSMLNCTSQTV